MGSVNTTDLMGLGRGAMRGFVPTSDPTSLCPGIVPSFAIAPAPAPVFNYNPMPTPVFSGGGAAPAPSSGGGGGESIESLRRQLATAHGQALSARQLAGRNQQLLAAANKTIAALKASVTELQKRRTADVANLQRLNKLVADQRVEMNRMYAIPACRAR